MEGKMPSAVPAARGEAPFARGLAAVRRLSRLGVEGEQLRRPADAVGVAPARALLQLPYGLRKV